MTAIAVFDEHHEAFLFWEEAVSSGRLHKGSVLLHVDGHHDLGLPRLTESVYTSDVKGFVQRQLNIGTFIIPALMRGIFKEVIFLGREDKPEARKKNNIGTLHGKGVWINPNFIKNKFTARLYPDARQWHYTIITDPSALHACSAVIDIDLDYFYGHLYPQPQFGITLTNAQLKRLKKLSLSEDEYRINLKPFRIEGHALREFALSKFKNIVYNDSKPWIECAISYFLSSLRTKPQLISICRSVKSGYTPKKYAEFAEETLIKYLRNPDMRKIDPCDITTPFEIYPFIACGGDSIYNPLADEAVTLKNDSRFIWQRIQKGRNFPQIFTDMCKVYDLEPEILKQQLLKFIFRLKSKFFIK